MKVAINNKKSLEKKVTQPQSKYIFSKNNIIN